MRLYDGTGDYTSATYYHKADYADDELVNGIDVSYWQADAALKKKVFQRQNKVDTDRIGLGKYSRSRN